MTTIADVQKYLRSNVDWDKFFSVVETIGSSMNGKKDRFDKSDVIEMALDAYSNEKIEYVNEDGVDHILKCLNLTKLEMKFSSDLFYKEYTVKRANKKKGIPSVKGIRLTDKGISLRLVNSMGTNTHNSLPPTYAKFLLAVDNQGAFVIKTKKLIPYLRVDGDGLVAKKVPPDLFHKVIGPEEISNKTKLNNFNYKEEKIKFQRSFLEKF
jgi:hypothetical protein